MADNKKIYTIQINGIEQSIKQVDALSDALQFLDKKVKEMESRNVSVSSSNGGNGNRNAELQTEDKLLKQIQSTEQQIRDARREDYQSLLAQKDVLKDIVSEAQERAAAERLSANNYENNMKGLKQELSDIKKVMQTTDLGDSESMEKLIKRANELNTSLKNVEESYGQFGRNVGNYKSAAEGFKSLNIEVNGVTRSFDNAKQALMELKKERDTLGISMGRTSKEFKELDEIVKQLQSDIKDMATSSSAMDNLLDTMESLTAIGSIGQGFKALFGFDNSEIEKSIQKLVALQNILKGIETINKQIQTREGIGGWIAPFNKGIDTATAKLLVYNRALLGTGKAAKVAATSINVLSKSMKAIASAGILLVISLLTDKILDLAESFGKADKAMTSSKKIQESVGEAYAKATAQLSMYQNKIDMFNGSTSEEKKLVKELNKDLGDRVGKYKSLTEWKKALKEKTDDYIESMMAEAEQQAILNELVEIYQHRWNAIRHLHDDFSFGEQVQEFVFGRQSVMEDRKKEIYEDDKALAKLNERLIENQKKLQELRENGTLEEGTELAKTIKGVEVDLAKARVDAMKQGLTKTLAQLELERNKRIAEAKKTGKLVQEQIKLINKQYQDEVFEARVQYHVNLINEERKYVEKIEQLYEEMYQKEVEISRKRNELAKNEKIDNAVDSFNNFQINALTLDYNSSDVRKYIDKFGKDVITAYINTRNTVEYLQNALNKVGDNYEKLPLEAQKIIDKYSLMLDEAKEQLKLIEDENEGIGEVVKSIGILSEKTSEAYALRTQLRKEYYNNLLKASQEAADKELVIEKDKLDTEYDLLEKNEEKRHQIAISRYYEDNASQDEKNRFNTPRKAFEAYMEEDEKGNLIGKNADQLGTYFSEYRKLMDEWVENLKKGVQEGKYTWEEYNEFMNQEAIQGYLKAKTEYENFLLQYNAMSDAEKAEKEGDLKKLTANLNNTYVDYLDKIRVEQDIHNNQMKVIQNKYDADVKETERTHLKERQSAYTEFYSNLIKETEDVLSTVSNKIDKAEKRNTWGIINYKATETELKDLQGTIKLALTDIATQKEQLLEKLKKGEISFGDYDTLISQLKVIETQAQDTANNVKNKLKNLIGDFWDSIDQWVQAVGQTMNQILGSLSEIQSNQYDAMIDKQEKYIEEYEKLLDKQKEITEQHASEVESIEDELSTARGDRRQQLIDQLNAEMAAQRASLAQEKKIEKEREKAEEKKKKLEYDQAVAKKNMQLAQAAINMAMAISMAAVNSWPVPAIPMMALAAAAGAAQIAAIKSQNIPSYGSGGVIQGKSHREGGVKVLGGQAEVEGGEYITNKVTTAKNVDLLEYINTKRRKINLEDLIDFYGGNSQVKKSITAVRTKFADGGMIPTLRNDINLSDRMLTAFEDYSNRPVQVAVVDIIDRTQQVNNVKVMAGIDA